MCIWLVYLSYKQSKFVGFKDKVFPSRSKNELKTNKTSQYVHFKVGIEKEGKVKKISLSQLN